MIAGNFFYSLKPDSPGAGVVAVTPADADVAEPFRSLVVFGAGDVKFTALDGSSDTWTIPSGAVPFVVPVAVKRVWATGTTATGIKGLL
jgi:hypothetical protein